MMMSESTPGNLILEYFLLLQDPNERIGLEFCQRMVALKHLLQTLNVD